MADRLTGMEVFVQAVRRGGISAAARSLRMSPAMAGKHIDALERRLGATLLHRSTRRLALTEAGADYLDRVSRIITDVQEAEAQVAARSVDVAGLLRVSAPVTFGVSHLAPLMPAFQARFPNLTVEFGFNDRVVDLLEEQWDVAVRIGRPADSSLISRKIAPMRVVVCASPAYLARRGTPRTIRELSQHDCLGYTLVSQAGTSTWSFGVAGAVKVPVRGPLHANNGEALVRAAVAGLGLVYGPRFIAADALARGELVEVQLDLPCLDLGWLQTIRHPERQPTAKTRAFVSFLAETLPPLAADW